MRLTRQKHNETMGFEHEHVMAKAASDGDEQAEGQSGPGTGQESAPLVGVVAVGQGSLQVDVVAQPVEAVLAEWAVRRSSRPVPDPRCAPEPNVHPGEEHPWVHRKTCSEHRR